MLISQDAAASMFGIGRSTLGRLLSRGEPKYVRIGDRRLIGVREPGHYVDRLQLRGGE